jgi:hypothetical protein
MAYDVYIQLVPAASYTGMKFYSFGQTRSLGVRGLTKLVTIFAKNLLTPLGTNPLDPDDGTDLPGLIGSNITLDDARDIIILAVAKVADRIQAAQSTQDVDNDERLADASVTEFVELSDSSGVAAQIYIQNVAGIGLSFLIPTMTARTT